MRYSSCLNDLSFFWEHRFQIVRCSLVIRCARYSYLFNKVCVYKSIHTYKSVTYISTGRRRLIECLKLQVILCKRATNYGALLWKCPIKIRRPMDLRHPVFDVIIYARHTLWTIHQHFMCIFISILLDKRIQQYSHLQKCSYLFSEACVYKSMRCTHTCVSYFVDNTLTHLICIQ